VRIRATGQSTDKSDDRRSGRKNTPNPVRYAQIPALSASPNADHLARAQTPARSRIAPSRESKPSSAEPRRRRAKLYPRGDLDGQ
jgi:hypothetical protein